MRAAQAFSINCVGPCRMQFSVCRLRFHLISPVLRWEYLATLLSARQHLHVLPECETFGGMSEIQAAIQALIDKHGGLRAAARAVDVSAAYLSRLHRGVKGNPGGRALRKIGLVKQVTYKARK